MADERLGRQIALQFGGTKMGNVVSADLSVDGESVEIANDDSEWTEAIQGRKSWTLSVTAHTDEHNGSTVQGTVNDALITSDGAGTIKLGPESPAVDDVTYDGSVIITNFSMSKSSDDVLETSYEFQGSGALNRTVTTA